jgi:signal transduction histidine kinase
MSDPWAWAAQQVVEFLAGVSSWQTESAAALAAVERVAEALDAEVVAIVRGNHVVASVGYPMGSVPIADLEVIARGQSRQLPIPGAGMCEAIAIPLDHPADATLIISRSGTEGLTRDEISLVRGMARVTSMTMSMIRLLSQERSLRRQSDRQAAEVAGLLEALTERQTQLEWLANEQAALRRVATLVASGVPYEQVLSAVAEEVARLAAADFVQIVRYDPDGTAVRVAAWGAQAANLEIGASYSTGGHNIITLVLRNGKPARISGDMSTRTRPAAEILEQFQMTSAVGAPIVVDGTLWGAVMASTEGPEQLMEDAELRIGGFTELVATAISNAQARAELAASRKRMVTAGDQMRRRIERDLHDGSQQRLIALAFKLRGVKDNIPEDRPELRTQLSIIEDGLASLGDELREVSRGLHPAILSEAGLGSALKSLASQAPLPVKLDIAPVPRLPKSIEAAAYDVVLEALANAAKHANASEVEVTLSLDDGIVRVRVRDDGAGGAGTNGGSGILGLRDRVEALGGTMDLVSPPGKGTSISVVMPIERDGPS